MEISELTLKLIILLIPGAIGSIIIERLTIHKPWTPFRFISNSILIGVFSYLVLQLISMFFCPNNFFSNGNSLSIWNNINESADIPYLEVFYSSIIGIMAGLLLTKADSNKWLNNFVRKIGFSNKYGDENLFSYYLNSKETGYIYVRYIKHNLTYLGYIDSFSETDDIKELVLSDVSVYSYSESELLYEIDKIYLSLPKDEVIIESATTKQ